MRKFHRNRAALYQVHPWKVVETKFSPEFNQRSETVFSLGNGYMGLRGTLEEGVPEEIPSTPGVYLNGIYETQPIVYGEFMACQPENYQTLINVTDWRELRIYLEEEEFSLFQGRVEDYSRELDLKKGLLNRRLIWVSPRGRRLQIHFQRFISQVNRHLALLRCSLTPLNFQGTLTLRSNINGAVRNYHHLKEPALQVLSATCTGASGVVLSRTKNSQITVACGVTHSTSPKVPITGSASRSGLSFQACFEGRPQENYVLEKYIAMSTSQEISAQELPDFVQETVTESIRAGYEEMKAAQIRFWAAYWEDADVQIAGDPLLQQGLRFNAFQLLQSVGRDGKTNIAAKGLSGEHYEGHYFWDSEIYVLPFFLSCRPELARKLLEYRYNILEEARLNARRTRDQGALYAWRTINGQEASGNFLGSTVQCHINAAIAYAIHKYVEATEDLDFLLEMGAEILFETARFWAGRGHFLPAKKGRYCLDEVCGPDEYKPGVTNNCYTNYMAQFNLYLALKTAALLKTHHPQSYVGLKEKLRLKEEELVLWEKCADLMYLPFHEELGIHPQDDSFLEKEPLPIDSIPPEEIPLVANWHPLVIWRYQLIKQADVLLLMFLLGERFSWEEKKANFDYYEPKTTHDSSLSPAIYSIIAAEVGYYDYAYNYFLQTARLDLDDYNRNTWQGIHTACMAGSWMSLVNGLAGLRTSQGQLRFQPYLPQKWRQYSFKIKFRGCQLEILVQSPQTTYTLLQGERLEFCHFNQPVTLLAKERKTLINHV